MNNKVKVCRLIKVLKLKNTKIISFKDIVIARAARAVKDAKVKGKYSRKYKNNALEIDEPELELEAARIVKEVVKEKKHKRKYKVIIRKKQRS
jgi:hypothetical protein